MTTEKRLAAIESELSYGEWIEDCDARWLIAKLRECNEVCAKGKAIIHDIADGSEYARGRADAVKAIREKANEYDARHSRTRFGLCYHDGDIADKLDSLADDIERGEHVEATNGKDV